MASASLWKVVSKPIQVRLTVASTAIPVTHHLGVVPDAMLVLLGTGPVYAADVHLWDQSVAYVQTTASDVRARLVFAKLTEGVGYEGVP